MHIDSEVQEVLFNSNIKLSGLSNTEIRSKKDWFQCKALRLDYQNVQNLTKYQLSGTAWLKF